MSVAADVSRWQQGPEAIAKLRCAARSGGAGGYLTAFPGESLSVVVGARSVRRVHPLTRPSPATVAALG